MSGLTGTQAVQALQSLQSAVVSDVHVWQEVHPHNSSTQGSHGSYAFTISVLDCIAKRPASQNT